MRELIVQAVWRNSSNTNPCHPLVEADSSWLHTQSANSFRLAWQKKRSAPSLLIPSKRFVQLKPQARLWKERKTHPHIPKPNPLLKPAVRIPPTTFSLDLSRPRAPSDRLQLLRSQNETNRDQDDGDKRLNRDIQRKVRWERRRWWRRWRR